VLVGYGSGTNVVSAYSSYRIKTINVMTASDTNNIPTSITLAWIAGPYISPATNSFTDTSLGSNHPGNLRCRPPPGSAASLWHSFNASDNPIIVTLGVPDGAVIDVVLDLSIDFSGTNGFGYIGAAGSSVNRIYGVHLDGASGHLHPIGFVYVL
jgi:hypothetical protein